MKDEPHETNDARRLLGERLDAIVSALGAAEASARVRDLLARASDYGKALQSWEQNPPSPAHRDALRDLIIELEVKVRSGARRQGSSPAIVFGSTGAEALPKHSRDIK